MAASVNGNNMLAAKGSLNGKTKYRSFGSIVVANDSFLQYKFCRRTRRQYDK